MHPRKKNEHGLTEREERFVRLLLDGKLLQREAYLAMNPAAAKWKTHVVDIKASLMAAKPHVQARFRALQAQLADVAVLKAADIPSILIEIGFMSNKTEAATLADPNYQKNLGNVLVSSIDAYFDKIDKTHP